MKIFYEYLKSRLKYVLHTALTIAVFGLVFVLYNAAIPLSALSYGAALGGFAAVLFYGYDFAGYYRLHRQLEKMSEEITVSCDNLPSADDLIYSDYNALIDKLWQEKNRIENQTESKYSDMTEYYTLWAHQIKTPIAAAKLILQTEDFPANGELSDNIGKIEQYADMVMCYLRLESSSTDYVIKRCSLDRIIKNCVKKFSTQFIRRKIRLEYEPLNTEVLTDEKWLSFVVEQVISNSLKYTAKGSVKIYCEGKTLCIADTGVGIAPEDLPRIFERGYTGMNGRDGAMGMSCPYGKASGIGLYLCREICRRLGHGIAAFSDENGTVIKIYMEDYTFTAE